MINKKYKFAYIGISKCASTTISSRLSKIPQTDLGQHNTMIEVMNGNMKIQPDYFIFTFIRNPFSRLVSAWNEFKKDDKFLPWKSSPEKFRQIDSSLEKVCKNFSEFVKLTVAFPHMHWTPFCTYHDKIKIDFTGRVENLNEDFDTVCDKAGIPLGIYNVRNAVRELPSKNQTKHKHYTEYYDNKTIEIITEKYANDLNRFGYKYGED